MRKNLFSYYILQVFLPLMMLVAGIPAARGEIVTQKQAQSLAQQFFNEVYKEKVAPVKMVYNGKRLTTDRLFTPFYVYNEPRGGFVIISAENKTFPILAYSLKENFNPDALSEAERGWLASYAADIELIRYDSRVPDEAIEAWGNFPQYIVDILKSPYDSTDTNLSYEEVTDDLKILLAIEDSSREGEFSAYYTPSQWRSMINDELKRKGNVAIGYVDFNKKVYPGIVHGRQGDYYRINFGKNNSWLVRMMPSEYLGERLVSLLEKPLYTVPEIEEEPAFDFYESYISQHVSDAFPSTNSIAESKLSIISDEPIVKSIGGGHFDIVLPENVRLAMLYNLNGSHLGRKTYGGSDRTAHINLEGEPTGFYIAVLIGESGRNYGVKLWR